VAYAELRTARNFTKDSITVSCRFDQCGTRDVHRRCGFGFINKLPGEPGYVRMAKMAAAQGNAASQIDNVLTFDKLTDVYNSGTMHERISPLT